MAEVTTQPDDAPLGATYYRYQVIGFSDGETDAFAWASTRKSALAIARDSVGRGRYGTAEVFDRMARRGAPNTWNHFGQCIGRRKDEGARRG